VNIDGNLENINIMGGGLHFTATATASISSLGDSSATITVFTNATVTFDTVGNIPGKNIVLTNNGTLSSSSTNTLSSQLTVTGAANNTISANSGSQLTITTGIIGNGGFTKNGAGPLFLGATNTYTGDTVVSGGTLALYGNGSDGSISSSALVNITGGALLDVSGRSDGTFTLASGQTLQGGNGSTAGSINGNFVASAGSIFAPATGTTNTGSIAVSTNAALLGSATMRLNASTGVSDQLLAYSLTYGGTLTVTNVFGTITNGQTFQLFVSSNGVYNAGSFSSITLPTAVGLTWTTNLAVNGSITANAVNVPPTQPNITGFNLTGTQLIISGTSSLTDLNYTYSVLNGTNLLTPLTNWTILSTGNSFNPGGNFRITNTVNPNTPQSYYMIRVP
jgi:autotransporter-associated beta strand protein